MRQTSFHILLISIFALVGCGEQHASRSLSNYVEVAMADLPYHYRMIPELGTTDYTVFKVINSRKNVDVTIAFGLPSRADSCARPPRPFEKHPGSIRHFSGAAARPLICLATDNWRPANSREVAIISSNMERRVVVGLCGAVYGSAKFEDFACFD
jgi:hypothetical protein